MKNIILPIMLLLDINFKGSDHQWVQAFVPDHLREEYALHGSRLWWSWVQKNEQNRTWVLERIKGL